MQRPYSPNALASLSLSLSLSLAAGACGSSASPAGDATFASASPAQLELAVTAGVGMGAALGYLALFKAEVDNLESPECPRREDDGATVTFIGDGCTSADGTRYDGRVVATNATLVTDLFGDDTRVDPSAPMEISFYQFRVDDDVFDGRVWQSSPQPAGAYRAELDLRIAGDLAYDIDLTTNCVAGSDGDSSCSVDGGFADLEGLGSFGIAGEFSIAGGALAGWLELTGADTLRVSFDAAAGGCAPYTVDGVAAGDICFDDGVEPQPEPTPEPSGIEIIGHGWGCGLDGLSLDAFVVGDVATADITVLDADGQRQEIHPLAELSVDGETGERHFGVELAAGGYAAGQSSQFTCDELDALSFRVDARDAAGASACRVWGADPDAFGDADCDNANF